MDDNRECMFACKRCGGVIYDFEDRFIHRGRMCRRCADKENNMTEIDLLTMRLREEIAFWKGRAIEGAATACEHCKDYHYEAKTEPECDMCRMKRIMEEAAK